MISSVAGVSRSSGSRSLMILTSSVANSSVQSPQTPMLPFSFKTETLPFSTGKGVLNPSTGEEHTVNSPIKVESKGEELEAYGFGYDESSDDYKVVRIIQTKDDNYSCSYRAEINCVRSKDFCRTIPLPNAGWEDDDCKSIGVFVGGSVHWCTFHTNSGPYQHVIDAIDLVSNTYHQLQFPDYNFGETGLDNLNVGIVDTRLSLCGLLKEGWKIGIWVMEEYGNPESWNRLYCIDCDDLCLPDAVTSVGTNKDQILLMLDWHKFSWCDPKNDADDTILADGLYEVMYCLESLVKIFPNQAADVKKHAYEKQLKKKLADQEILQNGHPAFLDLRNLDALMHEDFSELYDDYYDDGITYYADYYEEYTLHNDY
ncbi:F-box/kelch-repeat protein At3g06240 [Linum perenne]